MTQAMPKADAELAEFQDDLLQSVREYKAGDLARKTVVALSDVPTNALRAPEPLLGLQ